MAHDIMIIGTGLGGYVCAIRAAQLAQKMAVVGTRATDVEDQLLALLVH